MSSVFKTFQELLDYMDDNNITDEAADDGRGYTDTWRSTEFNNLINNAKEKLEALTRLPYPPSAEIVALFGKKEPPVTMSSVSCPTFNENGISYVPRIRLNAIAELRKELSEAD